MSTETFGRPIVIGIGAVISGGSAIGVKGGINKEYGW